MSALEHHRNSSFQHMSTVCQEGLSFAVPRPGQAGCNLASYVRASCLSEGGEAKLLGRTCDEATRAPLSQLLPRRERHSARCNGCGGGSSNYR